jgi:hypothetical protein
MDDVVASQGYVNLKRSYPCVILDVFERAAKSVIKETLEVQLPSFSLSDNLAKLMVEKKGVDVAFSVQGEVFFLYIRLFLQCGRQSLTPSSMGRWGTKGGRT